MSHAIPLAPRHWRWLAAGGLLILLLVWWFRPPAVTVTIATIDRGPIRVTIEETGTTRVRHRAELYAPITGQWVPAALEVGDMIRTGTLLGTLYPPPLDPALRAEAGAQLAAAEAKVREAAAAVESARTTAAEAERTAARTAVLGQAGAIAPDALEQARDAAHQAQQALAAAEARRRGVMFQSAGARAVLDREAGAAMPIRAPTAGILLEQAEVQPRVVAAGTLLAAVGNPADLEVLVPVLTTDVPRIREGATVRLRLTSEVMEEEMPARATVSSPRMPDAMTGRVERIEPTAFTRVSALGVEEQRVHVVVTLPRGTSAVPRLGDRFRLHASITVWEDAEALRVPVSALVREGTEWSVWVLANGRARRQVIRVGERSAAFAQLLSGLVSGEVVVAYPGESVRDGARLRQAPSR